MGNYYWYYNYSNIRNLLTMTKRFYKDEGGWFVDLPDLIADGTFTKGNLAMVLGADTLLDKLSNNGTEITIQFEKEKFKGWQEQLKNTSLGMDEEALEELNHPVELGGYYYAIKMQHSLWLCSVASFLFGGDFPKNIYIRVVS